MTAYHHQSIGQLTKFNKAFPPALQLRGKTPDWLESVCSTPDVRLQHASSSSHRIDTIQLWVVSSPTRPYYIVLAILHTKRYVHTTQVLLISRGRFAKTRSAPKRCPPNTGNRSSVLQALLWQIGLRHPKGFTRPISSPWLFTWAAEASPSSQARLTLEDTTENCRTVRSNSDHASYLHHGGRQPL